MDMEKDKAWSAFKNTGHINDYLRYREAQGASRSEREETRGHATENGRTGHPGAKHRGS